MWRIKISLETRQFMIRNDFAWNDVAWSESRDTILSRCRETTDKCSCTDSSKEQRACYSSSSTHTTQQMDEYLGGWFSLKQAVEACSFRVSDEIFQGDLSRDCSLNAKFDNEQVIV
jgi:hypothetical protein